MSKVVEELKEPTACAHCGVLSEQWELNEHVLVDGDDRPLKPPCVQYYCDACEAQMSEALHEDVKAFAEAFADGEYEAADDLREAILSGDLAGWRD